MKTPLCSSCKRGEIRETADFFVHGTLNGVPYRAYLCSEHLEDLVSNLGLKVRSQTQVPKAMTPEDMQVEYTRLCATVRLDEAGIKALDRARAFVEKHNAAIK